MFIGDVEVFIALAHPGCWNSTWRPLKVEEVDFNTLVELNRVTTEWESNVGYLAGDGHFYSWSRPVKERVPPVCCVGWSDESWSKWRNK